MHNSEQIASQIIYNTKNHWNSIDSHFQRGAVTVSLLRLPIMAANMFVINNSKQITFQLTYLQDQ